MKNKLFLGLVVVSSFLSTSAFAQERWLSPDEVIVENSETVVVPSEEPAKKEERSERSITPVQAKMSVAPAYGAVFQENAMDSTKHVAGFKVGFNREDKEFILDTKLGVMTNDYVNLSGQVLHLDGTLFKQGQFEVNGGVSANGEWGIAQSNASASADAHVMALGRGDTWGAGLGLGVAGVCSNMVNFHPNGSTKGDASDYCLVGPSVEVLGQVNNENVGLIASILAAPSIVDGENLYLKGQLKAKGKIISTKHGELSIYAASKVETVANLKEMKNNGKINFQAELGTEFTLGSTSAK